MAKPTAPLFSLGAKGTLADAITYSSWKGVDYVRTRVVPANPKTTSQMERRDAFSVLAAMWNLGVEQLSLGFNASAAGRPYTGRNRFMGLNLKGITPGDPWGVSFQASDANSGALPPSAVSCTDAGGQIITAAGSVPAAPTGWTYVGLKAVAILNTLNDSGDTPTVTGHSAAGFPFNVDVNVAGDYCVAVYVQWTDPQGVTRYSRSLSDPSVVIA